MSNVQKKSMMDANTVKAILVFIAQGGTVKTASDKFKRSTSAINNILSGATYAEVTGLGGKKSGVTYVRANADMFTNPTKEKKAETPAIEPTTKTTTETTKPAVVGGLDLSTNLMNIRSEAEMVQAKIVTRMDELKQIKADADAELQDLETQSETWTKVQDSFRM